MIIKLGLMYLLGIIAPGPNLAAIINHSLLGSRKSTMLMSLGVIAGTALQILIMLFSWTNFAIHTSLGFKIFKYFGSMYLLYIGGIGLFSKKNRNSLSLAKDSSFSMNKFKIFRKGFFISVLNPMLTVFLISIFSAFVYPHTSGHMSCMYTLVLLGITSVWFIAVGLFISNYKVQSYLCSISHWIERLTSIFLIYLGVKLWF